MAAIGVADGLGIRQALGMQDHGDSQAMKPLPSPQPAAGFGAIALRPATPADTEFCYRLHKAAMGDYIAAIWGWDEQVQRAFHDRAFNPHRWQIITAGHADIGMLDVGYRPGEICLSRIEIDPGHQGLGIGSQIISALLQEAERNGQDLVLEVLTVNRRARALYARLGLTEVASHGTKVTMRSARHRK
jgi:ribosomal protein S18 acetylase RimI-like enzyme